jgi:hypothetical protein
MSILECSLAAEKEMDGKPFTICNVGTWWYVELHMLKQERDGASKLKVEAERLYDLFGNGKDSSERGITLAELKEVASNGGISIIPKTKDDFIDIKDWKEE